MHAELSTRRSPLSLDCFFPMRSSAAADTSSSPPPAPPPAPVANKTRNSSSTSENKWNSNHTHYDTNSTSATTTTTTSTTSTPSTPGVLTFFSDTNMNICGGGWVDEEDQAVYDSNMSSGSGGWNGSRRKIPEPDIVVNSVCGVNLQHRVVPGAGGQRDVEELQMVNSKSSNIAGCSGSPPPHQPLIIRHHPTKSLHRNNSDSADDDARDDEIRHRGGSDGSGSVIRINKAKLPMGGDQHQPATVALDVIQKRIDDAAVAAGPTNAGPLSETRKMITTTTSTIPSTRVRKYQQGEVATPSRDRSTRESISLHSNGSPSPILLNPLTSDWRHSNRSRKSLLCPTLESTDTVSTTAASVGRGGQETTTVSSSTPSTSLEELLLRLEEGFLVRLDGSGDPTSGWWKMPEDVLLSLHKDRTRLCVRSCTASPPSTPTLSTTDSKQQDLEEKKDEVVDFWIEIKIDSILRLEVCGRNYNDDINPSRCFSLIVKNETTMPVYYNFEAASAIEREVLFSTILVLVDQTHNTTSSGSVSVSGGSSSTLQMRLSKSFMQDMLSGPPVFQDFGGTIDQPIPCSPSLEEPQQPEPSSVRWKSHQQQTYADDDENEDGQLSPRKSTKIFHRREQQETETSLVIDLEDLMMASRDEDDDHRVNADDGVDNADDTEPPLRMMMDAPRRRSVGIELPLRDAHDMEREAHPLAVNPSAGSTVLTTAPGPAWCTDDTCTLALNDIADACWGLFAIRQAESSSCLVSMASDHQQIIEEYIATVLGAPGAVFSCFMETTENALSSSSSRITESNNTESKKSRLRNRASLLNAQATRLRTLRSEMTFAAALKQSQERMQYIQTTQSFDDMRHRSNQRARETAAAAAASGAANQFHSSALLRSLVGTMMSYGNPDTVSSDQVEPSPSEDVFYDSDPEDTRPRNTHRKGPRRASHSTRLYKKHEATPTERAAALSGAGFEHVNATHKVSKKLDDDVIVRIVQAMNNERLILMWHPTQTAKEPNQPPRCIKLWIESGVYFMDGSFVMPKLTWSKAYTHRQQGDLRSMDLLDICRIRPTDTIDRGLHPFASLSKSFTIETPSEYLLLEAQSTEERERIVYGLKLVIARLASLLMLRDIRAAEEFFGAIAASVPGEAPSWAQTNNNNNSSSTSAASPSAATQHDTGGRAHHRSSNRHRRQGRGTGGRGQSIGASATTTTSASVSSVATSVSVNTLSTNNSSTAATKVANNKATAVMATM